MTAGASRLKRLIDVARDGSGDTRRVLLREITDIFVDAPHGFSPTELQHIDAIMSRLAEQAETPARHALAETLADTANSPRGLVRQLARDEIAVAAPLLNRSAALSENDLLGIIRQRGPDHLHAITQRRVLPESLTAEIAEHGDEAALVALALNKGARFSSDGIAKMVANARAMKGLQRPMIERFDVPAPLLTRMYFYVSATLKQDILKRSDMLDPALVDEAVTANRRKILAGDFDASTPDGDARQFIREHADANRINERLLADILAARRAAEFRLAFSYIAGIDLSTAQAILKDRSLESLALACRAADLEMSTFEGIIASLQPDYAAQTGARRMLDLYSRIPQDAAERVMRFWRVRAHAPLAAGDAHLRRRPKLHELGQRSTG